MIQLTALVSVFALSNSFIRPFNCRVLREKSLSLNSKSENEIDKFSTLIIGAGISGLACAKVLSGSSSPSFLIVDKEDKVGGRVQTDLEAGYMLDRGFQIFINSYPQVVDDKYNLFDSDKLGLAKFNPGALVRLNNQFYKVSDPLRQPNELFSILFTPIGSFVDKLLVGIYSIAIKFISYSDIKNSGKGKEKTTVSFLKEDIKISDSMINSFFKPFYQGIFLSPLELQSSRMFQLVFKVLSQGYGCLPAKGMQSIPDQIYESIASKSSKNNVLLLQTSVNKIDIVADPQSKAGHKFIVHATQTSTTMTIERRFEVENVVVATDSPSAKKILDTMKVLKAGNDRSFNKSFFSKVFSSLASPDEPVKCNFDYSFSGISNRSSTCLYYGFEGPPPVTGPTLILNGENDLSRLIVASSSIECEDELNYPPAINNVCFPSQAVPGYAPAGCNLASVTVIGSNKMFTEKQLDEAVREQLSTWWGKGTILKWKFLKAYRIAFAQPSQQTPYSYGEVDVSLTSSMSIFSNFNTTKKLSDGLYMCGDHVGTATLNGAIESGIRVGERILAAAGNSVA